MNVTNLPMLNPEIVTGVSLMLLMVFVANLFGISLGMGSIILAHITFCLPYVILSILPKLGQMDPHLYEAAQDLARAEQMLLAHDLVQGTGAQPGRQRGGVLPGAEESLLFHRMASLVPAGRRGETNVCLYLHLNAKPPACQSGRGLIVSEKRGQRPRAAAMRSRASSRWARVTAKFIRT